MTFLKPHLAPALPIKVRQICGKALVQRVDGVMLPPLLLILLVLGNIFFGIATPTEAGAVGSFGAMILAAINRRLNWAALKQVCDATLRITTMVIFILIGSLSVSRVKWRSLDARSAG